MAMKSKSRQFPARPAAGRGQNALPPRSPVLAGPAISGTAQGDQGGRGEGRAAYARYLDTTCNHLSKSNKAKLGRSLAWALRRSGRGVEADAVESCGAFFQVFRSPCGSREVVPISCHHALCPECGHRDSLPLQRRVLALTRCRKKTYRFLTLTLVNTPEITRAYVARLVRFFAKLRSCGVWKARVLGGVYSLDTTYNGARGDWHVHLHIIIEANGSLPPKWIFAVRDAWREITGGSHVVHMRAVNRRAVKELVKYQAKTATFVFSPELVDSYLKAFRHVRRIQAFGSFLGVDTQEPIWSGWRCSCGGCGMREWAFEQVVPASQTKVVNGKRMLDLNLELAHGPPVHPGFTKYPAPVFDGGKSMLDAFGGL